jgi:hypothetical protein
LVRVLQALVLLALLLARVLVLVLVQAALALWRRRRWPPGPPAASVQRVRPLQQPLAAVRVQRLQPWALWRPAFVW